LAHNPLYLFLRPQDIQSGIAKGLSSDFSASKLIASVLERAISLPEQSLEAFSKSVLVPSAAEAVNRAIKGFDYKLATKLISHWQLDVSEFPGLRRGPNPGQIH